MSNILVLSPHPDDDCIGCGGTIRKHVTTGDHVEIVYLTSGERGFPNSATTEEQLAWNVTTRENEASHASQVLGTHHLHFLREPDGKVDHRNQQLQDAIYNITQRMHFDRIYAPHQNENHTDHEHTWALAHTFEPSYSVWYYEVWTPLRLTTESDITEYTTLVYQEITAYAQDKHAAIYTHESQRGNQLAEATLALNRYRGITSGKNYYFAEAFLTN